MADADAIEHVHRAQEGPAPGPRRAAEVYRAGDGRAVEHFVIRQTGDRSGTFQAVLDGDVEVLTAADKGDRPALLDFMLTPALAQFADFLPLSGIHGPGHRRQIVEVR